MDSSALIFVGCAVAIAGLLNQLRMRRGESRRLLGPAASVRSYERGSLSARGRGDSASLRLMNAALMTAGLSLAIVGVFVV